MADKKAPATAKTPSEAKAPAPRGPKDMDVKSTIHFGRKTDPETKVETAYGPKNNPKRDGTKAADRFALYKEGMTVEKALAAGVKARHIRRDSAKGFIEVRAP